jgi:hypothetical protein
MSIKRRVMRAYGGMDVYLHAFLTLNLGGGGQLYAPAALPTRKEPQILNEWEAGWPPGSAWPL